MRLCSALSRSRPHARARTREGLAKDLELSGMAIDAAKVADAANRLAMASGGALAALAGVAFLLGLPDLELPLAAGIAGLPIVLREAVLSYPSRVARRRAEEVLKDSTRATNLMIMSLGREASLSKAILFASRDESSFSGELRRCVWSVVMGSCASFEEALHSLGGRWARFSGELEATMNAMVTASCEATENGRRRALDRANSSMISGAKRRIEEYALSLSTPSMVMFGLGILLPLMVGSFLPMLSWNLWSFDDLEPGSTAGVGDDGIVRTVFLMNILFPALGFLVASNAVAHHPLETKTWDQKGRFRLTAFAAAGIASTSGIILSGILLDGFPRSAAILLSLTGPMSGVAIVEGLRTGANRTRESSAAEDALFVTGARMLEGENFEAALERATSEVGGSSARTIRSLSFRSNIVGQDFETAVEEEAVSAGRSNALEAFRVVKEAASKDEQGAGLLAMDLAAYLKDLRDLEGTLKGRLKPTISMMRMTAYALGPIVMGITYAIYVSMGSITGGAQGGLDPNTFMLVLGVFLAETGIVVNYFVWGIEGRSGWPRLFFQAGACVLTSELVFLATSFLAS